MRTELPVVERLQVVSAATGPVLGVRQGEELLVDAPLGDHFNAGRGSKVRVVDGGEFGENFEAVSAWVIVDGGQVDEIQAMNNAVVSINGGRVADVSLDADSVLDVSGGSVGSLFGRGRIKISGGQIESPFLAGNLTFVGTAFSVDGQEVEELELGVPQELEMHEQPSSWRDVG